LMNHVIKILETLMFFKFCLKKDDILILF